MWTPARTPRSTEDTAQNVRVLSSELSSPKGLPQLTQTGGVVVVAGNDSHSDDGLGRRRDDS